MRTSSRRPARRRSTDTRGRAPLAAEQGKGTIRGLITLLLVVVVVYAGLKFIPVRAAAFQFDDAVREQVVLAGSGRRRVSDDEIRNTIHQRARELGVPIEGRDIHIRRNHDIRIEVTYTKRIEFPLDFHYDWTFHVLHEGPSF